MVILAYICIGLISFTSLGNLKEQFQNCKCWQEFVGTLIGGFSIVFVLTLALLGTIVIK